MEHFYELFSYFREFGVIVCQKCQYAVVPSQIKSHLNRHHLNINSRIRKQINSIVIKLEDIAHMKEDVRYPIDQIKPIVGLPIFSDGLRCD